MKKDKELIKKHLPMCIAFLNRKGGVGKTVVSTSMAYTYSEMGYRTLLIDIDPQASASQLLGVNRSLDDDPLVSIKSIGSVAKKISERGFGDSKEIDDLFGNETEAEKIKSNHTGLYDLMLHVINGYPLNKEILEKAVFKPCYLTERPTRSKKISLDDNDDKFIDTPYKFDLLNSSEEMNDCELFITTNKDIAGKQTILKTIIEAFKKYDMYDVILIDCPPSLGLLTINAMTAADGSVVVGMPDEQSIFSLAKIKKNFRDIKKLDDDQMGILGFLLNAIDKRSNVLPIIEYKVRTNLHLYVFKTKIKRSINATKSNSLRMLFPMIDPSARDSFKALADEIIDRYISNVNWEKYRKEQYAIEYKKIRSDEKQMEELIEKATKAMNSELEASGIDMQKLNKAKYVEVLKLYIDKQIKQKIRDAYDNNELWRKCTYDFYSEDEDLDMEEY